MAERGDIREWLGSRVAALVGAPVDEDRPFDELGLSSRDAVAVSGELAERLDRPLPPTLLWEHPTIARLVEHLEGGPAPAPPPESGPGEPIAVIGLGCRFPGGATGPGGFWGLLRSGRDGVGAVPPGRWESFTGPGQVVPAGLSGSGGFLERVDEFDAEFFGISPREAAAMDPQQRLLLEVAWEAVEHAGLPASSVRGSATGVFVGVSSAEYGFLTTRDLHRVDAWTGTGAATSIIANRLSYFLDLRGPSMTVDTACSSSLVAVHQACASLRRGESRTALAAGVNLLLSPAITASFGRAEALASDGRCKAFDAGADGIVRGEGCGVVVLKRLADARRDGDRILALIRGSAVNSDGRSNGLMAPNPESQADLLRAAYADADLDPSVVDYVEAHGTGTQLGDPIEARALGAVLGTGRAADRPLLLGSVKTNIGHLEAAAGIAGLIKVVLAFRHGEIPPSLHYTAPNPHIPFEQDHLEVVADTRSWPRYSGTARAGVSGFGFGGTNAHVVVEAWPRERPRRRSEDQVHTLLVSGQSEQRLRRAAGDLANWLDLPNGPELADVGHTLLRRRTHHQARGVVVGRDRESLVEGLRALAENRQTSTARLDAADARSPGVVWVFSGHGSQWPGMCRRLLADEPAFARAIERQDPEFASQTGFSLADALAQGREFGDVREVQLGIFGVQVALSELWQAHGVRPAAVIGHSMGEVAAAVVAGALDFATGLRVMAVRARLLSEVDGEGGGAMAVVEKSPSLVDEMAPWFPGVSVAVRTSPNRCTIAGPADEVAMLVRHVDGGGGFARLLDVSGAGHTAAVDPMLDRLRRELGDLDVRPASTTVYSTSAEDPKEPAAFDAEYWVRNLRSPVRFEQAVRAAAEDGFNTFVEISPHPVATAGIEETLAGTPRPLVVFSSRRNTDDTVTFRGNLAALQARGLAADTDRYRDGQLVDLPAHPWQRQRHWAVVKTAAQAGAHRLLGAHVELPDGQHVWQLRLDADLLPWLSDHRVHDVAILPGTAYLDMVLSAAAEAFGIDVTGLLVEELGLHQMLRLDDELELTTTLEFTGADSARISVHTRSAAGAWILHASAVVSQATGGPVTTPVDDDGASPVDLYPALRALGQHYGPAFQGVAEVRGTGGEAVANVQRPDSAGDDTGFAVHPAMSDACLQSLIAAGLAPDSPAAGLHVPVALGGIRVWRTVPPAVRCHARLAAAGNGELTGSVLVVDPDGEPVLEFARVRTRPLDERALPAPITDAFLETRWESSELPPRSNEPRNWLLIGEDTGTAWALRVGGGQVVTDPGHREADVADALDKLAADPVLPIGGVVVEASHGAEPDLLARVARVVRVLQHRPKTRLWLVTRGTGSWLRALVRVLAIEHPGLRASLVDLAEAGPDALVTELLADSAEDEVSWRGSDRLVARLHRAERPPARTGRAVRPGGYVITGGLGALGLVVARWLAERGARRIVLNSRRGLSDAEQLSELTARGAEVEVVTGDVSVPGVAKRLIDHATRDGMRLCGVVHAAGVLCDQPVTELGEDAVREVWKSKVDGARRLHEATVGVELDWWVVFSSAAGLLGSPGQAAYATANAALDELVLRRRELGLPATSIQWGAWEDTEAADGPLSGVLGGLTAEDGIEALEAVLRSKRAVTGVSRLDIGRALDYFPELAHRPFFAPLVEVEPSGGGEDLEALRAMAPEAALAQITGRLTTEIATVLGTSKDNVDPARPLTMLGLDSLMAMRARGAIERHFGLEIGVPLLLRGASLNEIAAHLAQDLGVAVAGSAEAEAERVILPRDATERWVAQLWREALNLDVVGVTQDFRSVGGNDELAEHISEQISARLGAETPGLFAGPATVEHLADQVRSRFEAAAGPVRVLRAGGSRPPLFLFHPAGGPTSVYQPLAERLGDGQPCYGMERLDELHDVPGKARRYVELIREIQPGGPYRLAGWSFGGCLAYETAQQLTAVGAEVELVALVDTILPLAAPAGATERDVVGERLRRFAEHIERTYGHRLEVPPDDLGEEEQMRRVMEALAAPELGIGAGVLRHQYTSYVDARVAENYSPRPYGGRVVLYRAQDAEDTMTTLDPRYLRTDEALGWDEHVPALEVVRIPGNHLSLIDPPQVDVLAGHLRPLLEATDGGR
ncbi:SDR family NAD(P)-dependent oxidoreductase [Saccharopolyspora taberi]|uniref:Type I polyketide synthase n=1 Tax=Saccharopolyspora taberi TaxID=60895 RepID=A0ABN3VAQ4_9PSEU